MALTTPAQKPRGAARISADAESGPARCGTPLSSTGAKLMIILNLLLQRHWGCQWLGGRRRKRKLTGCSWLSRHWNEAPLIEDELASAPLDAVLEEGRTPHSQSESVANWQQPPLPYRAPAKSPDRKSTR